MKTTTHTHTDQSNTQLADSSISNILLYQYEALLSGYDLPGDSASCPFPLLLSAGLHPESGIKDEVNNAQHPADKKATKTAPI